MKQSLQVAALLCCSLAFGCASGPVTVDPVPFPNEEELDGGRSDALSCIETVACTDSFVLCVGCVCPGALCGYTPPMNNVFDAENIRGTIGEGVCLENGECAPKTTTPNWDPCPSNDCASLGF